MGLGKATAEINGVKYEIDVLSASFTNENWRESSKWSRVALEGFLVESTKDDAHEIAWQIRWARERKKVRDLEKKLARAKAKLGRNK